MFRLYSRSNASNIFKQQVVRNLASDAVNRNCKLLVIGGGSGGCSVAAKFVNKLGKDNVVIIEPSDVHYYQPMFTLVGGGMKSLKDTHRSMKEVLPKGCQWIKDSATNINPAHNIVTTSNGSNITYEYLVVAIGLQLNYNKVEGLEEALSIPDSGVCSNFSPKYVTRTYDALKQFKEGNLLFTFPNTPIKCAGAPLKICMVAEDYLSMNGIRDKATIDYYSSLGVIFGVKKYADALWEVCNRRHINIHLRHNLVCVDHVKKVAVFENLDNPTAEKIKVNYSFLHATPPMSAPRVLSEAPQLTDKAGYLDIDKCTLRHKTYPNIFGIGDCTNLPTSKTAAAVAAQSYVLYKNLEGVMDKKPVDEVYNGYTSCPLVSSYNQCILAEFDYDLQPLETFPINQSKESRIMFHMKKDVMPWLYWNLMLKGLWNGPGGFRKLFRLGMK